MKKIIALLIMTLFLASCSNSTKMLDKNESPEKETPLENITQTGEIDNELENIVDEKVPEKDNIIKKEKEMTGTTDEAALEEEVNDLLDEFIDSLDSYEK